MEDNNVIESLNTVKTQILEQIKDCEQKIKEAQIQANKYYSLRQSSLDDLKAVERLLAKRDPNADSEEAIADNFDVELDLDSELPSRALKPADALKWIINRNPEKLWSPGELRDNLEWLRKHQRLDSSAKNLLWIVHSSIKSLIKDFLVRDGDKYIKRINEDESLLPIETKRDYSNVE